MRPPLCVVMVEYSRPASRAPSASLRDGGEPPHLTPTGCTRARACEGQALRVDIDPSLDGLRLREVDTPERGGPWRGWRPAPAEGTDRRSQV
jgi:hypothetical protein